MIKAFEGRLAFCSNFTFVPHLIHGYKTVEHFFVAMKTEDEDVRARIKKMIYPGQVKRFGRDELIIREDWDAMKLEVMEYALRQKFKAGTALAQQLLDTGDEQIVELNYWHDNYWGECTCQKCEFATHQNHLGHLLM